jgi:hypothetical protein
MDERGREGAVKTAREAIRSADKAAGEDRAQRREQSGGRMDDKALATHVTEQCENQPTANIEDIIKAAD